MKRTTMSDPAGERYPLWLRYSEKGLLDVIQLLEERFGTYDDIRHERPLTPAEELARGT
jgi:hypothetical protein